VIDWLGNLPDGVKVLFDILASIGTLAAAVLAAITIRQAKVQAKESQDALLLERQVEFRLGLLKETEDHNARTLFVGMDKEVRRRATLLPVDLIPVTRAVYGLATTDGGQAQLSEFVAPPGAIQNDVNRFLIRQEIESAIEATLGMRELEKIDRRNLRALLHRKGWSR
jgi:hypothetical protein